MTRIADLPDDVRSRLLDGERGEQAPPSLRRYIYEGAVEALPREPIARRAGYCLVMLSEVEAAALGAEEDIQHRLLRGERAEIGVKMPPFPVASALFRVSKSGDVAELVAAVFVDGQEIGALPLLSGPAADVGDFLAGRATLAEVRERWARDFQSR